MPSIVGEWIGHAGRVAAVKALIQVEREEADEHIRATRPAASWGSAYLESC
ncbi:MAG: hypothetical protein NHB36_00315 [Nitrospira sp.]|nr:hypothetical protein [Nitrospira sp.]